MEIVKKIELSEEEQNAVKEFIKMKNKFKSLCCDNNPEYNCDYCPFYFCCSAEMTEEDFIKCLENIM